MIRSSDLLQFSRLSLACIPDLNQAGGEGEWSGGWRRRFCRDVESDIVSVETETVTTNGVTKGENFCDEEEGICTKSEGTSREMGWRRRCIW